MNTLTIETNKKESKLEYIIAVSFLCSNMADSILDSLGIPGSLFYIITATLIIFHFLKNYRKVNSKTILYYIIISPFLFKGLYDNYSSIGEKRVLSIIFNFYPAYYLFKHINIKTWIKAFSIYSYLSLLYYLPQVFITNDEVQYMDFAYSTLMPMCFVTYQYLNKKKFIDLVFVIISIPCMLIFGCRGALVAYILFLIYMLLINKNIKHRGFIILIFGILAIIILFNLEEILIFLQNNGFNSRTIEKILSGTFAKTGARNAFYELSEKLIELNNIGYGVLGSRPYIQPYPHSMYYEMLLDFGIIIGPIMFIYIMYTNIYELIKVKNENYRIIISIIAICGITRLLLSSSIYHQMYIPALLALHSCAKAERKIVSKVKL